MRPKWILLAVGLFVLLVQSPAREGAFLDYDDDRFIVENEHLDEIANPLRYFTSLEVTASGERPTRDIYRPLRTFVYALLTAAFGRDSAEPFHWASILFHVAATVLLGVLLLQAGVRPWIAGAGAALFGVHPVVVETTAWACSLGDAMCGAFALWSVVAYARDRHVQAFLALALALFAKEHAVVVPGFWFAWDAALRPDRLRGRTWARAVPGLLVVVAFLVLRGTVLEAKMSQVEGPLGGSWPRAVRTMLAGLGWYASCILFPFGSTFYAVVPTQYETGVPVVAGFLVLAALAWGAVRGPRLVRFGCLWFLVGLVPVSNLFVTLKIPTADRFLYLPLMGLVFPAAALAARTPRLAARLAPAVVAVTALLCVARIGDWKDDRALVAAWKETNPRSPGLAWVEGATWAKMAAHELREGDALLGGTYADRAQESYLRYFRNVSPADQIQARIELANLLYEVGRRAYSETAEEAWRGPWAAAMEHYLFAFRAQQQGIGRLIPAERRHVAERIVAIGMPFARPFDRHLGTTLDVLRAALGHLASEHGRDIRYERARLLLVAAVRQRAEEPENARRNLDLVLELLDDLEEDGVDLSPHLRAEAFFYRAILEDRGAPRVRGLQAAEHLYRQAARWADARGSVVSAINALIQMAEAQSVLASHGHELPKEQRVAYAKKAVRTLEGVPAVAEKRGVFLPARLARERESKLSQARAALRQLERGDG